MLVLDTHALLWWTLDPTKLSRKAEECCSRVEREGGYVSSISLWELGIKIRNGNLSIGMGIRDYAKKLGRLECLEIVPVDAEIWMRNLELKWEHRDPADRTIVATALGLGVPVLSKDKIVHSFAGVDCVW